MPRKVETTKPREYRDDEKENQWYPDHQEPESGWPKTESERWLASRMKSGVDTDIVVGWDVRSFKLEDSQDVKFPF
jgi:hypothetical protein